MTSPMEIRPVAGAVVVSWDQGGRSAPTTIDDTNSGFNVSAGVMAVAFHKKFISATKAKHILVRTDQVDGDWEGGNFSDDDRLLFTDSQSQKDGPIVIEFVSAADLTTPVAVAAAGAQLQTFFDGEFTGVIRAIGTSGAVFEFRRRGDSNANRDGSAVFLGATSDGPAEIVRIEFLTTNIVNDGHARFDKRGFAINQLSVVP